MRRTLCSLALAAILSLVASTPPGAAAQEGDDVTLESVQMSIDVKADHSFEEVVETQIRNLGSQKRDLALSARSSGVQFSTAGKILSTSSLSIAPKESKLFRRTASGSLEGSQVRRLIADPTVRIGGRVPRGRIGSLQMEVKLPPGAKRIVSSSLPPTSRTIEGGRVVYRWHYTDTYPVRLFVLYQTTPYELSATKRLASRAGETIEVEIEVKNLGSTAVEDIHVVDDFPPFLGTPAPGQDGFSEAASAQSESRLIYRHTIPSIPAGGTAVASYKLLLGTGKASLRPSRIYVGETLIVTSNRLELAFE